MNTWLYRRCKLYRSLFKDELLIRELYRSDYRIRMAKERKMKTALTYFECSIKNNNYKEALEAAAFYINNSK